MIPVEGALATYEKRAVDRVAARLSVQVLQNNRIVLREYSVNMSVGGIFWNQRSCCRREPLGTSFRIARFKMHSLHCQGCLGKRNPLPKL